MDVLLDSNILIYSAYPDLSHLRRWFLNNWTETFTLHDSLQIDDHNVPSILVLPDGHLIVFYNEHNGDVFIRKSILPADITQWEPERIIAPKNE